MKTNLIQPRRINWPFVLKYFILFVIGGIILVACSFWQYKTVEQGEYYYSTILRSGYNAISIILFCIVGFVAGYMFKLNPWLIGSALILIFPMTSIIESSVYRGSHNLIPFEFAMHFLFSLPATACAYLGKYFAMRADRMRSAG